VRCSTSFRNGSSRAAPRCPQPRKLFLEAAMRQNGSASPKGLVRARCGCVFDRRATTLAEMQPSTKAVSCYGAELQLYDFRWPSRCYSLRVVVSLEIPNKALIPPMILLKIAKTKVVLNPNMNGIRTIIQSSIAGIGCVSKNA